MTKTPADVEIRIGVSRCLLGEHVRYDGGHKHNSFVVETLGPVVHLVPVCPEVEMGMSTPREAIRLMRGDDGPRLVGVQSGSDYTTGMRRFAAKRAAQLRRLDLHGYILKKGSPSCGLFRVPVHGTGGAPSRDGRGSFASALADTIPGLPMEEEGASMIPGYARTSSRGCSLISVSQHCCPAAGKSVIWSPFTRRRGYF